MNERFENIVFFQGEAAEPYLQTLTEKGEEESLKELSEWHAPGEHETREDMGHGTSDRVYEKDGYILSYNLRIGYIGLKYDTQYEQKAS